MNQGNVFFNIDTQKRKNVIPYNWVFYSSLYYEMKINFDTFCRRIMININQTLMLLLTTISNYIHL